MNNFKLFVEKQWLHVAALAVLLAGIAWVWQFDGMRVGQLWGLSTPTWFALAIAIAIAHQVFVWFCWRSELHLSMISSYFGHHGFNIYAALFAVFGIARILVVFALAYANAGTLNIDPIASRSLAILLAIPALYTFYSVKRYFGYRRAVGADHFDPAYRKMPMVNKGIFRFTSNGMYLYGFLFLWVPAFWFLSAAALCVALFNHAYIWIHYFCTEAPDMRRIYGNQNELPSAAQ